MIKNSGSSHPRSKTDIYLRFFVRRIVTQTRGASTERFGVSSMLSQVKIFARGLVWLAKNRNQDFLLVACSGQVSELNGRIVDEKIDYYLSKVDRAKIYIGDPAKGVTFDKINEREVLIPLLFLEVIFLPITILTTVLCLKEVFRLKQRHKLSLREAGRLALKYATKKSKSWCLYLLAKMLPLKKIIINDGYAQNIEMVDMGNKLLLETVEVQHGIIAPGHYGYSDSLIDFPSAIPGGLVVWNESAANYVAWRNQTIISVIDRPSPIVCVTLEQKRIIIIGQPSIQSKLLVLYAELNTIYPGSIRYRPHPRENDLPIGVLVDDRVAYDDLFLGGFSTMLLDLREHVTNAVYALESLIPYGYRETLISGRVNIYKDLTELKNVLAKYHFSRSS